MSQRSLVVAVLGVMCVGLLPAQHVSIDAALRSSDKPFIQAIGNATISMKPDQAVIEIGVITEGMTSSDVAVQNARQTASVIAEIRKRLTGDYHVNTLTYSLQPRRQYPKPGAPAVIAGYTATNVVEVILDDLSQMSVVIDNTAFSGANTIRNLRFRLKDPASARDRVLKAAAERARASAESIASGLGLKVVRVLSATDYALDEEFGMAKKAPPLPVQPASPTPIEVQSIEFEAAVMLRVEVAP